MEVIITDCKEEVKIVIAPEKVPHLPNDNRVISITIKDEEVFSLTFNSILRIENKITGSIYQG